jgi:hypothetical protein
LDTVLLDSVHGGMFVDAEVQLGLYRKVITDVESAALGVVESKNFIHQLAQRV